MSNDGLIIEYMDLSHIHLAVTRLTGLIHTSFLSSNSFYFIERRKVTNSVTKITIFSHGGKLDFFFVKCTLPNSPVRAKVLSRFQFEGKNNV
jgi:hypothetical protein